MEKQETTVLGTNFFKLGWGYRVFTMRGWVTVDTKAELDEELNDIMSLTKETV